jgi:hypothetical protein
MPELKIDANRVRKAASECKDADKVLRTLFPEAFVPEFKAGDIVQYNGGHHANPDGFIVVHPSVRDILCKAYGYTSSTNVQIIGLNDGNSYAPLPHQLQLKMARKV